MTIRKNAALHSALVLLSVVLLAACSKSQEFYVENIEEAYKKAAACGNSGSSEECGFARSAVYEYETAQAHKKKQDAAAKKEAEYNRELSFYSNMSDRELFDSSQASKCKGSIQCRALTSTYNEMIERRAVALVQEIQGELHTKRLDSRGDIYQKHCKGLGMDLLHCLVVRRAYSIAANLKNHMHKKTEDMYFSDRSKIIPAFSECKKLIQDEYDALSAEKQADYNTSFFDASHGIVSDYAWIKCNSLREVINKMGFWHEDYFRMSEDDFERFISG